MNNDRWHIAHYLHSAAIGIVCARLSCARLLRTRLLHTRFCCAGPGCIFSQHNGHRGRDGAGLLRQSNGAQTPRWVPRYLAGVHCQLKCDCQVSQNSYNVMNTWPWSELSLMFVACACIGYVMYGLYSMFCITSAHIMDGYLAITNCVTETEWITNHLLLEKPNTRQLWCSEWYYWQCTSSAGGYIVLTSAMLKNIHWKLDNQASKSYQTGYLRAAGSTILLFVQAKQFIGKALMKGTYVAKEIGSKRLELPCYGVAQLRRPL